MCVCRVCWRRSKRLREPTVVAHDEVFALRQAVRQKRARERREHRHAEADAAVHTGTRVGGRELECGRHRWCWS